LAKYSIKTFTVWLLPLLVVILQVALLQLVLWQIGGIAFGFVELLITLSILLYSLGRNEFDQSVGTYLRSWNNDDLQGAYIYAQVFSCL
jgi:membrane protein required for beta-lactamase induction